MLSDYLNLDVLMIFFIVIFMAVFIFLVGMLLYLIGVKRNVQGGLAVTRNIIGGIAGGLIVAYWSELSKDKTFFDYLYLLAFVFLVIGAFTFATSYLYPPKVKKGLSENVPKR